jgi:signal transduction histidine kinase
MPTDCFPKSHNGLSEGVKNLLRTNPATLTASREHEGAVNQLRRSEAYLAEAQRLTRTGSWAWVPGSEGELENWHYWSEEMFRIFEFDPREGPPTSKMWWQRIHPEDRQQISESIQKALQDKGEYVNNYRIQFPDGRLKYIRAIGHPMFNDAGEIGEFVGTSVDVTEQKHTEEALRRSEAYLAEGQRLTHTGSWSLNIATRQMLHSSAEHTRMLGFEPEKGLPSFEEFLQRIQPEDQKHVLESLQALVRSGGDLDLRYRIAAPDCPVRYMHAIGHPVLEEPGPLAVYVGITIDTTERRQLDQEREQAEKRLRRSEAYLAEAQKLSHSGSWAIDPVTGKMTYYSEEMFRIMGLEPALDPPDSEAVWQRVHPEDLPPIVEGIEVLMAASKQSRVVVPGSPEHAALVDDLRARRPDDEYELRVVHSDGTLKYLRSYGHPILDETGKFVDWVGTTIDVTEHKKAEFERERLRQLEADLAHTNRISMLGELAASLSHELKQPIAAGITSASATLNWLTRGEPNIEEARGTATATLKAGKRAVEIIDRLRALYTKAPPKRELLDGNEIIREMVALLRVEANRYKVSIHADFAAEVPMIMADRVQLQQVLMNLMLNAIEAMKETGGSLSVKSWLNQEGLLQISVSDTGPGLPAMKEKQIFEPFFTTKPQGSGMGLAICRSIVESHGGCLWAAPNGDRGAYFNFTLPVTNQYEL